MPLLATIKREWRRILGIVFCAFGLWVFGSGLYRALTRGTALGDLSYGDSPFLFVKYVTFDGLFTLVFGGLLLGGLLGWRRGARLSKMAIAATIRQRHSRAAGARPL